ncbi:MAG: T9SS type A sorting domain-containing protein [bacterium]
MSPIKARNMANKEMQAEEISITINTQAPQISELLQSYPNPANQGCYIPFKLAKDANVSLEIYNILGQKVRTIEIGQRKAGSYTQKDRAIFFDLKNDSGQNLSSGLYFYKIKADDFSAIKSMVVQ